MNMCVVHNRTEICAISILMTLLTFPLKEMKNRLMSPNRLNCHRK